MRTLVDSNRLPLPALIRKQWEAALLRGSAQAFFLQQVRSLHPPVTARLLLPCADGPMGVASARFPRRCRRGSAAPFLCLQAGGLEAAVRYTLCTSRGLMEDDEVDDGDVVST